MRIAREAGWIFCVIYSTIPSFWLLIHPRAEFWRSRRRSPYRILLPLWIMLWVVVGAITVSWRGTVLYENRWAWIPALFLFALGLLLYRLSHSTFTLAQLGGLPEILPNHSPQQLVTTGIRARVRHPVYLGHLCEMLAWSLATGLAVCWTLTAFAMVTGAAMIQMEEEELTKRFGQEYLAYRDKVPAILFKI